MAINAPITTRAANGTELTWQQMDGNLISLQTGIASAGTQLDSIKGNAEQFVNNIAALRLISKSTAASVQVNGYYTYGDGGGGAYALISQTSTGYTDNGGSIIIANDGGVWKLQQTTPVSIRQFGAKGDGVTNDRQAVYNCIQNCLDVYIPTGTFNILPTTMGQTVLLDLTGRSGIRISGGGDGSVIQLGNNAGNNSYLFGTYGTSISNVIFTDFSVNLNAANNLQTSWTGPLTYNSFAYFFGYCENMVFRNMYLHDGSGSQWIRVGGDSSGTYGKNIRIEGCRFRNFGLAITGNLLPDVSVLYIQADGIQILNNSFENDNLLFNTTYGSTACELHGDQSTQVIGNRFANVQLPILLASQFKATNNIEVSDNTFSQCCYMGSLNSGAYDQNNILINDNEFISTVCAGGSIWQIGAYGESAINRKYFNFKNNTIIGWGITTQGVHLLYGSSRYINDINVSGCDIQGLTGSVIYLGGSILTLGVVNIVIQGNILDSLGATSGSFPNNPTFVHYEPSSGGINSISIEGNTLLNTAGKSYATYSAYRLRGPINYTFVKNTNNCLNTAYPLINDVITGAVVKKTETTSETKLSSPFALAANGTVNLATFSSFGINDFATLRATVFVTNGASSTGSVSYQITMCSTGWTATATATSGTYAGNITMSFSSNVLRVVSTAGVALTATLQTDGFCSVPIAWSV